MARRKEPARGQLFLEFCKPVKRQNSAIKAAQTRMAKFRQNLAVLETGIRKKYGNNAPGANTERSIILERLEAIPKSRQNFPKALELKAAAKVLLEIVVADQKAHEQALLAQREKK
ncbi:MAG: hypothetical protein PHH08_04355 [Candidatus ainarchaeum sp.]|nr:hypothetical protein [Candidatus ainarchaeum sp.]